MKGSKSTLLKLQNNYVNTPRANKYLSSRRMKFTSSLIALAWLPWSKAATIYTTIGEDEHRLTFVHVSNSCVLCWLSLYSVVLPCSTVLHCKLRRFSFFEGIQCRPGTCASRLCFVPGLDSLIEWKRVCFSSWERWHLRCLLAISPDAATTRSQYLNYKYLCAVRS